MSNTLTEQHQSIRNSKPINWHQFHQDRRSIRIRTGEGKTEDSGYDGQDPVVGDEDRVEGYGEATYDETECVGLYDVYPGLVACPS